MIYRLHIPVFFGIIKARYTHYFLRIRYYDIRKQTVSAHGIKTCMKIKIFTCSNVQNMLKCTLIR